MYGVKDSHLSSFVTTEKEKKKGRSRMPMPDKILISEKLVAPTATLSKEETYYNETDKKVVFSDRKGEYGYLENSYLSLIILHQKSWPSVENYFQAMKFPTHPDYQE